MLSITNAATNKSDFTFANPNATLKSIFNVAPIIKDIIPIPEKMKNIFIALGLKLKVLTCIKSYIILIANNINIGNLIPKTLSEGSNTNEIINTYISTLSDIDIFNKLVLFTKFLINSSSFSFAYTFAL